MVFGIFYYLINGIAWYCVVLYCVVGFGARAVSGKTPIYFILIIIISRSMMTAVAGGEVYITGSYLPLARISQDNKMLMALMLIPLHYYLHSLSFDPP